MEKVFIGSQNKSKIKDWKDYLSNIFDVLDPYSLNISLEIPEGLISIQDNSKKKAIAWNNISKMTTISDDTGFYINALEKKPGVAVRRWGGQLPENTSNKDFLNSLRNKMIDIDDTSCYFETCITIITKDHDVYQETFRTDGYIDKNRLNQEYISGYPLGMVFKTKNRKKIWNNMNIEERKASDKEMIDSTITKLKRIYRL